MPEDETGKSREFSRRRMLALAGTGLTVGVAGCNSGGSDDPAGTTTEDGDDEPTTEGTDPTTTSEPVDVTVPEGGAYFGVEDGFATPGDWVEDAAVYKVTEPTRDALDAALNNSEPRIVVFETSGTIDLEAERFTLEGDKCWIAGQTAPSPGVTLTRGDLWINASDCVVQHLRVRPGDAGQEVGEWQPDTIRTANGTENNIIDHCTATWSVDENVSPGYDSTATTLSNCIIAEALNESTHQKGAHAYGSLIADGSTEVAVLGNVFAHNIARNPRLKGETESAVVNNLMFDYEEAIDLDESTVTTIIGNTFDGGGPNNSHIEGGEGYLAGNVSKSEARMTESFDRYAGRLIWPTGLEAMGAAESEEHALNYAGARPADRTEHDERIVANIRDGVRRLIDSQEEVGGYPDLAENTHELNVPDSDRRDWLVAWAVAVEEEDVEAPSA